MPRHKKLFVLLTLLLLPVRLGFAAPVAPVAPAKPNVVLILTDDQGFGELGVTGNPVVRTPNIDRFAAQCVTLTKFGVMPVCSPTRASLLTGRYYYRTGLTDTWMGRSLMSPDEVTLAQMFTGGGYRTGIFGKWHLGDNFPRRPMDRGFQESLVLNGGGLAQPGDPPDPVDERGAYFDATLSHNGVWHKTDGYVSDVITTATLQFIEENRDRPFFAYLAFNCPHAPHQVPENYSAHYPPASLAPKNFPTTGHPMDARQNVKDIARVYGMIENIDDNVARVLTKLDQLKLSENTIVVLLSDNGCQEHHGYNSGFRGWKGTPYEGGIHQFCFVRWPGTLQPQRQVDRISSDMDLAPTLLDLCGVAAPEKVKFDGRSLAPLLRGESVNWPDRYIVFQWHRGDAPERYRAAAIRSQDWKLVQPNSGGKTDFQLYDMAHDPLEMNNLAAANPARVAELKAAYDAWFDDISKSRDFSIPQRIDIGAPEENPVLLTRQDWRGPLATWGPDGLGYWELEVVSKATYDVKLRFDPATADGHANIACSGISLEQPIKRGDEECLFKGITLPLGPARLEASLKVDPTERGVKYVEVRKTN